MPILTTSAPERVFVRTQRGAFLSAGAGGSLKLAPQCADSECFTLTRLGSGAVAFRSETHGTFLSADGAGAVQLAPPSLGRERFKLIQAHGIATGADAEVADRAGDLLVLRSLAEGGACLSARDDGTLAQAACATAREFFRLESAEGINPTGATGVSAMTECGCRRSQLSRSHRHASRAAPAADWRGRRVLLVLRGEARRRVGGHFLRVGAFVAGGGWVGGGGEGAGARVDSRRRALLWRSRPGFHYDDCLPNLHRHVVQPLQVAGASQVGVFLGCKEAEGLRTACEACGWHVAGEASPPREEKQWNSVLSVLRALLSSGEARVHSWDCILFLRPDTLWRAPVCEWGLRLDKVLQSGLYLTCISGAADLLWTPLHLPCTSPVSPPGLLPVSRALGRNLRRVHSGAQLAALGLPPGDRGYRQEGGGGRDAVGGAGILLARCLEARQRPARQRPPDWHGGPRRRVSAGLAPQGS